MAKDMKQNGNSGSAAFAVRPFSAIKGITVEKQSVEPKPVVTSAPREKTVSQAEEDLLFLTEMAGVARVHSRNKSVQNNVARAPSGEKQPSHDFDESRLFIEALKELKLDVKFVEPAPGEEPSSVPRKANRMRQVRRGTIRLDLEIDLHGLTRDEAIDALVSFIAAAVKRGQQAVLVIAGKGVHSAGEPVLNGAVRSWLAKEGKEWVSEFVPAPQQMGGDGAFVVFLKGSKSER